MGRSSRIPTVSHRRATFRLWRLAEAVRSEQNATKKAEKRRQDPDEVPQKD